MNAKTARPATDVDTQQGAEVALIQNRELLARFAEMAVLIPADMGNGTENILTQILAAETWDDLDSPWESSDISDILGKEMTITDVKRRPSSFKGGLGQFLVVFLQDKRTGEKYVKSTGSISVVGQIARAYAIGAMPLSVRWVEADRPTENGYYPQHLVILDGVTPDAK